MILISHSHKIFQESTRPTWPISKLYSSHTETTHSKALFHDRWPLRWPTHGDKYPDWRRINQLSWTTHAELQTLGWEQEYVHCSNTSQLSHQWKNFSNESTWHCLPGAGVQYKRELVFSTSKAIKSRPAYYTWVCIYNNNNTNANVYGTVIMAEPLWEFTRFIWWM